jgi:putative acetyltransferase
MKTTHIRDERPEDIRSVYELTSLSFQNHPYSQHTEQLIVDALRDAGALTVSLVAELDGHVVGHVAVSPVSISDGSRNWYGLGPISVTPDKQRQGIGSMLMREAMERMKILNGQGCVLVGDKAFYGRFVLQNYMGLIHEGVPQEFVLALSLDLRPEARMPKGIVAFHGAFLVTA